ncbi:uncharacterized protein QC763_205713 [Podospora pseudopauciseta]|uniref:Uncharacterized protein n=1 Tax=Podospora pseudopauciseta TaxID=2093780 RepID=A0ABR0HP78_9PEZI|nr:hypothetical protein QC763_205713 [Podospora pseudopauciseta]
MSRPTTNKMSPLRTTLPRLPVFRRSILTLSQLRQYSSSSQKPTSQTGVFYKAWTRPVAKTALLAVFVYQLAYWGWSKLEVDDIKEQKKAEIIRLEAQVKKLQDEKRREEK